MEFTRKEAAASILMLLSLPFMSGCGDNHNAAPSNLYTTGSIYAYMKAVQDESGAVATTVQLRNGPTNTAAYIYLSAGETLYASLDNSPQQYFNFNGNLFSNSLDLSQHLKVMSVRDLYTDYILFHQIFLGTPEYYVHDTPVTSTVQTVAYVGFERAGNTMTGVSSVQLPPVFLISAPAADAIASRATPITLTWTSVDPMSTMELDVAGSCLDNTQFNQHLILGADTGTFTLNSANYFPATGTSPATNCRVAFILQRARLGGVSPQFAFGSFKGVQQRTVQFTSTP